MDEDERLERQRERIFVGLETVLADRSFNELTVADVVAAAGTSKRTFYQLYPHKGACLLDHYERRSEEVMVVVEQAVLATPHRLDGIEIAIESFFRALVEQPGVARAHLLEIFGLGDDGVQARLRVQDRFAEMVVRLADAEDAGLSVRLDLPAARSLLGTVGDLAVRTAVVGRMDEVQQDVRAATAVVRAALVGLAEQQHAAERRRAACG